VALVRVGFTVKPHYCGMRTVAGQARDVYMSAKTWIEFDKDEFEQRLAEVARDPSRARRLVQEIEKFSHEIRIHRYMCGTFDCQVARREWRFEKTLWLLRELGVSYRERSAVCEEAEKVELDDYDPLEAVLDALRTA
jgi:replicative superfamily II helicase